MLLEKYSFLFSYHSTSHFFLSLLNGRHRWRQFLTYYPPFIGPSTRSRKGGGACLGCLAPSQYSHAHLLCLGDQWGPAPTPPSTVTRAFPFEGEATWKKKTQGKKRKVSLCLNPGTQSQQCLADDWSPSVHAVKANYCACTDTPTTYRRDILPLTAVNSQI